PAAGSHPPPAGAPAGAPSGNRRELRGRIAERPAPRPIWRRCVVAFSLRRLGRCRTMGADEKVPVGASLRPGRTTQEQGTGNREQGTGNREQGTACNYSGSGALQREAETRGPV